VRVQVPPSAQTIGALMKNYLYIMITTSLMWCSVYDDAKAHFENKEYDKALAILEVEIDAKLANAKAFSLASEVAAKLDNLDDSNAYILKAIESDPANKKYREYQKKLEVLKNGLKDAKKTFDSGYHEEALSDYDKLAEKFPENAMVQYTKGLVHKQMGNLDAAVQHYKKAILFNPFEEKYEKAIKVVAQTLAKNGDEEFRRKEYDAAIIYYHQAVSYYSNFKDGTFRLAKTYFSLRDFENAQKWCEETIYIDSTHVQSIKMLGDINKRGGNIDKAIELYRQAIGINVNYDRAYYSLGVALKDVGRYDEAIQALNKALLVNPTYTKAYETLGVVYQEDNDLDNAVFNFNKALDTDGKAYKVYSRLASVYNTQNKYEDARASAKACLKIKRNYAAAMCELGIAEMNMCNRVAAEDAFTKAKKDRNYRKFASDYLKNLDYYTRDCN
jgi:tetratricopeptide (TPR) repeat protein